MGEGGERRGGGGESNQEGKKHETVTAATDRRVDD